MTTEPFSPAAGLPSDILEVKRIALAAHNAGLPVLPALSGDEKRPDPRFWPTYQHERIAREALAAAECDSLGLVAGLCGVECIDFDMGGAAVTEFARRVQEASPGLWERLYQERTPSCPATIRLAGQRQLDWPVLPLPGMPPPA